MNGVIVVDKEKDFTSFDVVAKMRGILHQKKIGHGGTLDPQATGVLPVFLGNATKLCDALPDDRKTYEAGIRLGIETDTEDIWGNVLRTCTPEVTEEEFRGAVLSFIGDYDQVPPMVSAKKVDGKKLYELARAGKTVERKPVRLRIEDITILNIDGDEAKFRVSCEKGTYIRTLSADIGRKLGCGACMTSLRRLRHGNFTLEQAHTLDEIARFIQEGRVSELVIPTEDVLPYPSVRTDERTDKLLHNGNKLQASDFAFLPSDAQFVKVFDSAGVFCGLYKRSEEGLLRPEKMFL
ncbi:MAG: tRNA pseudouridine(55) synthase TruB [Lachnospiraceae bacterium]|nr:tRNA pseudouridine(55) synthase TruB [Lachnospiraceae bacterium]